MTLAELLKVLTGTDELLIMRDAIKEVDQKILYKGYVGMEIFNQIPPEILGDTVKRFSFHPEIRHREWEKRNLMPPMDPYKTPNFKYSDLQMTIYYKIILEGG
ncbi:MAG: hypothetical protein J1E01_01310 [Acetatifactor sp.]|nr:hypothetical protein [Acetatifactor sp.]